MMKRANIVRESKNTSVNGMTAITTSTDAIVEGGLLRKRQRQDHNGQGPGMVSSPAGHHPEAVRDSGFRSE